MNQVVLIIIIKFLAMPTHGLENGVISGIPHTAFERSHQSFFLLANMK